MGSEVRRKRRREKAAFYTSTEISKRNSILIGIIVTHTQHCKRDTSKNHGLQQRQQRWWWCWCRLTRRKEWDYLWSSNKRAALRFRGEENNMNKQKWNGTVTEWMYGLLKDEIELLKKQFVQVSMLFILCSICSKLFHSETDKNLIISISPRIKPAYTHFTPPSFSAPEKQHKS